MVVNVLEKGQSKEDMVGTLEEAILLYERLDGLHENILSFKGEVSKKDLMNEYNGLLEDVQHEKGIVSNLIRRFDILLEGMDLQ